MKSFSEGGATLTEGPDYTDINGVLTRTVSTNFDADGNFSQTYTIVFDTPQLSLRRRANLYQQRQVVIAEPIAPLTAITVHCQRLSLPPRPSSSITAMKTILTSIPAG